MTTNEIPNLNPACREQQWYLNIKLSVVLAKVITRFMITLSVILDLLVTSQQVSGKEIEEPVGNY